MRVGGVRVCGVRVGGCWSSTRVCKQSLASTASSGIFLEGVACVTMEMHAFNPLL